MTPTRWAKQWTVPSKSNPELIYIVSMKHDGGYVCSCPAGIFQRTKGPCKHIRAVERGTKEAVLHEGEFL